MLPIISATAKEAKDGRQKEGRGVRVSVFGSIQDAAAGLCLSIPAMPGRRRQWRQWLAERFAGREDQAESHAARLGWWPRRGLNGCGFQATFDALPQKPRYWLKWLPRAAVADFQITYERMQCWRRLHPHLAAWVADITDCSAPHRLLLLEYRRGVPLSRTWTRMPEDRTEAARMERQAAEVGAWLRAFAFGNPPYGPEVEPLLGDHAWLDRQGRLRVDARRQLECRIEQGRRAADALGRRGLRAAVRWAERFDLDGLLSALSTAEPAGFIHGDMKPDNVLAGEDGLSIIDWWTTPRVGWSAPDAAMFSAHVALYAAPQNRDRLLRAFRDAYGAGSGDETQAQILELIARIWMIRMAAQDISRWPLLTPLSRRSARLAHLLGGEPLLPR